MQVVARCSTVTQLTLLILISACTGTRDAPTAPPVVERLPCAPGSVSLGVAQSARVDCSNGGMHVQLPGNGASYLVVAQFPTGQVPDQFVRYSLSADMAASAPSADRTRALAVAARLGVPVVSTEGAELTATRQEAADAWLRARGRGLAAGGALAAMRRRAAVVAAAVNPPPPAGSIRSFHVLASFDATSAVWQRVAARLQYVGSNILVYVDTLAPADGVTPAQWQQFGQRFDQTLYPIDTVAFGQPSDVDNNGRVIVLMSPIVNGDTPAATCAEDGYIAGFFDPQDFAGPSDTVSNQGEIFYAVVPDPNGLFSCAHSVSSVSSQLPATFLHELQHLINFSQHAIVHAGAAGSSWLDEGLSIVAEELGSLPYEAECPPPTCRTNPQQLFPDSSLGFALGFTYDSYHYAQNPDTASLTLHDDSENGFSWRGGDWTLARWLGDQMGSGFYKKLEQGPSDGIADIEAAAGQSFPALFANFGLALYTDSLPGLPRNTAPAADRFLSRNIRQLWTGWETLAGPQPFPLPVASVTTDTTLAAMDPGTMAFYRLDTPAGAATVTLTFAAPGGTPLAANLLPQLAIFRLPAGQ